MGSLLFAANGNVYAYSVENRTAKLLLKLCADLPPRSWVSRVWYQAGEPNIAVGCTAEVQRVILRPPFSHQRISDKFLSSFMRYGSFDFIVRSSPRGSGMEFEAQKDSRTIWHSSGEFQFAGNTLTSGASSSHLYFTAGSPIVGSWTNESQIFSLDLRSMVAEPLCNGSDPLIINEDGLMVLQRNREDRLFIGSDLILRNLATGEERVIQRLGWGSRFAHLFDLDPKEHLVFVAVNRFEGRCGIFSVNYVTGAIKKIETVGPLAELLQDCDSLAFIPESWNIEK